MVATDQAFFCSCLIIFFLLPPISIISLYFRNNLVYGRLSRSGKELTIPAPLAWFLFESPTLWLTILLFPLGQNHSNPKSLIHISFYLIHYFHRTILYPIVLLLSNPSTKGFPVRTAVSAFVFNLFNAYLQVRSATQYTVYDGDNWFWWRFVAGVVVYVIGMAINVTSDYALLSLKSEAGGGYIIPRGGLFELVSCPNYFGEIMEWLGWALVSWSWAGFAFFFHSFGYLLPRGLANHKWYLDKFGEDYPKNRKAVIPFVC